MNGVNADYTNSATQDNSAKEPAIRFDKSHDEIAIQMPHSKEAINEVSKHKVPFENYQKEISKFLDPNNVTRVR